MIDDVEKLEYHTFLHHSQTEGMNDIAITELEYHTFLHHSQTYPLLIMLS